MFNRFWVLLAAVVATMPTIAYAQSRKPAVAIYPVEDLAKSGQGDAFSTMIGTAIASSGKFRVLERQLQSLTKEQLGAKAGTLRSRTPGVTGGFEGADYLVYGSITTMSSSRKANFGSSLVANIFSKKDAASVSCNNMMVTLGVDVKITNASSGEVMFATRLDERATSAAACGADGLVDATSLLRSAADKIATGLVTTLYPIRIAAVQGDGQIILNYGQGAVALGALMAVYSVGAPIIDPATGEKIGSDETLLGLVKVAEVTPKLSKAMPVTVFGGPPPIGSVVRLAPPGSVVPKEKKKK